MSGLGPNYKIIIIKEIYLNFDEITCTYKVIKHIHIKWKIDIFCLI